MISLVQAAKLLENKPIGSYISLSTKCNLVSTWVSECIPA